MERALHSTINVTLSLHGAGEGHVAAEVVASAGQHEVEAVLAAVAHQDVLHRAARRLVRLQEGDAVLRGAAAASCGGGGGGGAGEDLVEEDQRHGGGGEGEQPPGGRAGHHEPSLHSSPTTAAMLNASPFFTQLRCWQRCADLLPTFWLGEGQAGGCSDPDHGQCVGVRVVCTLHSAHTNTGRQACVHTTAGTARTQRTRFLQHIYRLGDGGFEAEIKKNICKS